MQQLLSKLLKEKDKIRNQIFKIIVFHKILENFTHYLVVFLMKLARELLQCSNIQLEISLNVQYFNWMGLINRFISMRILLPIKTKKLLVGKLSLKHNFQIKFKI